MGERCAGNVQDVEVLSERDLAAMIPQIDPDANKYTRGTVAVIGGSAAYPGAPIMSALAASRCGAGYVRLITVDGAAPCAHAHLLSIPVTACTQSEQGMFCAASVDQVNAAIEKSKVLAIGPGMGTSADTEAFLRALTPDHPMVLDADALNMLAKDPGLLDVSQEQVRILTPHEGEAARLLGRPVGDRLQDARELADRFRAIIVLKGPETLIVSTSSARAVRAGGPELAKAGTGDVLTGMIASFTAQGLEPFDAASLAVYVHGRAGSRVAHEISMHAVMPEDIINAIGPTLLDLERIDFS